jgi:monoamine oxidase
MKRVEPVADPTRIPVPRRRCRRLGPAAQHHERLGHGHRFPVNAPRRSPAGSGKGKKVAILGAGLAGMTAAYELSKLGYQVEVLEARPFAGGRCQTARKGFTLRSWAAKRRPATSTTALHQPRSLAHSARPPVDAALHRQFECRSRSWSTITTTPSSTWKTPAPVEAAPASGTGQGRHARPRGRTAGQVGASRQLDTQLTAGRPACCCSTTWRTRGALDGKDLAYRGRNGRGWAVNPGRRPESRHAVRSAGFRELLASGVGKVYSAVQEFPMHEHDVPAGRRHGPASPRLRQAARQEDPLRPGSADHPPEPDKVTVTSRTRAAASSPA